MASLTETLMAPKRAWIWGMGATAILSIAPLLLEHPPVKPAVRLPAPWSYLSLIGVLEAMWAIIILRTWMDREALLGGMVLGILSLAMSAWHHESVDLARVDSGGPYIREEWQQEVYQYVLNREKTTPDGFSYVPHVYRPLPYGFTRTLEHLTGNWRFACFAYRWFFTYWFLWASYWLVRRFHGPAGGWVTIGIISALYPFSIWYYYGQLTDPMSHALFVLAMIYIIDDRWLPLACALGLGIAAKETAMILVFGYWLCCLKRGSDWILRPAALIAVCLFAYVAVRAPLGGWTPNFRSINATEGLMIASNLGIGMKRHVSASPIYENYLFPLVYVGLFLPFIAMRWQQLDDRVKALLISVVPLLLLSNLCFGWMHEGRNYMPLIPLLASAALPEARRDTMDETVEMETAAAGKSLD
jgi:hypothetical protein